MNEFGAELDRQGDSGFASREHAAADAIARFQQADSAAVIAELGSCDEPGGAGAHDQSVEMLGLGHAAQLWHNARPQKPRSRLFVPQQ